MSYTRYDSEMDFFVNFDRKTSTWDYMYCNLMAYFHENIETIKRVSEEEATALTNGITPYEKLNEYIALVNRNRGITSNPPKKNK